MINKLGGYNSEFKIGTKDITIMNSRNIYNTYNNRVYQSLQHTKKSIIQNTAPEQQLSTQHEKFSNMNDYYIKKDIINISYDYTNTWETVTPKYEKQFIPQKLNYYKQKLYPNNLENNLFNKLYIDIDYNHNYLLQEKSIDETMFLNILVKKQYAIELYEINLTNIISSIADLIKKKSSDLDLFQYLYTFRNIIEYCFTDDSSTEMPKYENIYKTQSTIIRQRDKILFLNNNKFNIEFRIQDSNNKDIQKELTNISNGLNIIFVSNYQFMNKDVNNNYIENTKYIQVVDGDYII